MSDSFELKVYPVVKTTRQDRIDMLTRIQHASDQC
jgi:hypothetical protein